MDELTATPAEEVEDLFLELVRASIVASHYVIITRSACDWANENLDLGRKYKAHLTSIKQDFTTKASILQLTHNVLKVGIGSSGLQTLSSGGYQIGHRALLRSKYLEQPVLLVENAENDGDFVRSIFHMIKNRHPVKNFAFDTRHGGGSTIVSCFNRELSERRIAVCLVDSDKVAPSHPDSATVKGLRQVANLGTYVGEIFVTKCREVENHLPLSIIKNNNLCPSYNSYPDLNNLIQREGLVASQIWLYFDVKCGFRGIDYDSKKYSRETHIWTHGKFVADDEEIKNVNLSGFGQNILRQFLDSGPAMAEFAAYIKTPLWNQSFDGFYEEMLWFFAADKRFSTAR